jgi:hypothetical protein
MQSKYEAKYRVKAMGVLEFNMDSICNINQVAGEYHKTDRYFMGIVSLWGYFYSTCKTIVA